MDRIFKDITGFIQDMLVDLYGNVSDTLADAVINCTTVTGLSSLLSSTYSTPFAGLESAHCQMKYYKEALGFVVSTILRLIVTF